ncbi:MAG TPA: prepilin cleavage protein, partial [Alteromonas sp.]|nr:prepilin cleavage protein [Alteromonas sp.]
MNVRYQGGYSLIEIMIAMTLAVGSLAAVSSLVGYGVGVNGNLLNSARLNEELGNVYALIIA